MKNLVKIPRNHGAMFCWENAEGLKNNEVVEETPTSKEEADQSVANNQEAADSRKWRNKVNEMIEYMESPNLKEKPEGFDKIPASKFLKLTAEKLRELFISKNGVVTFHGHHDAYMAIGLSDFFPKISKDQQFVVVNNITYAYGARRRDGKIGYGNPGYKAIKEGNKIDFFIAPPKKNNDSSSKDISFVKDEHGNEITHYKELNYENLAGNAVGYLGAMENLSPREEKKEQKEFRKKEEEIEKREELARKEEAKLGLDKYENFKDKMEAVAKKIGEIYNLPWEVIYAQAALESGRGKSKLTRTGNNYFGIKALKDWDGPSSDWSTLEEKNGETKPEMASFRGYSSIYDSAIGYAKFINKYSRYKPARDNYRENGNPYEYLEAIKTAGYATDSRYVEKVVNIFQNDFGYEIPDKNNS